MRPGRKLLAAIVVGPILTLLLAEGALRLLFPVGRRASMAEDEVQAHMGYGFAYDPDLYWYWKDLPDPTAGIDAHGFRRREPIEQVPPPGVRRVITLGDSQTFGGGVPADQAFPNQAEELLGDGWEVLNAGISGYRSLNIYRLVRKRLMAYQPHYLLIDAMPKDSPREDGPLVERKVAGQGVGEALWNSRVYYFGQLTLRLTGLRPWETLPWPLQLHEVRTRLVDPSQGDLRTSPDMGNHDLIGRYARQQGTEVIFMRYPVQQPDGTVGCMAWEGSLPEGYPVFDACAVLSADGRHSSELFIDNNHLRPEGNRVVATALAAFLVDLDARRSAAPEAVR
ncbi:hypothetical protein L6R53_17505 [Myxococcota bacterium]|nr:hypothetical protein [Myxococcota bacterium]